jgi:hypothetical protein
MECGILVSQLFALVYGGPPSLPGKSDESKKNRQLPGTTTDDEDGDDDDDDDGD